MRAGHEAVVSPYVDTVLRSGSATATSPMLIAGDTSSQLVAAIMDGNKSNTYGEHAGPVQTTMTTAANAMSNILSASMEKI